MSLTRHKLKKEALKRSIEKTEGNGGRKNNPKILPYYALKTGKKMEVVFIPYEDGDLFKHFKKHGPNTGAPKAGSINCIYHATDGAEECPACQKGLDLLDENNKGTPESKRWMPKDYYVAQVVVVNSPVEIPELEGEDAGNPVRIFMMPYNVMEQVVEAYKEGIVEDPTEHIFVIKKTENQGGRASYANSFFRPKPFDMDEIIDAGIDPDAIQLHDLVKEKIQPEDVTAEEVEEWVEKAEVEIEKQLKKDAKSGNGKGRSRPKSEEEEDEKPDTSDDQDDDDDQDTKPDTSPDDDQDEEEEKPSRGGSRLQNRLKSRLKRD